MARVTPHKDMTPEDLKLWRQQQAGEYAWKRNQTRPGWTQARAAHWYGVCERQWARYEAGDAGIPLALVKRMIAYETSFAQAVDRIFDTTPDQSEKYGGIFPELEREKA